MVTLDERRRIFAEEIEAVAHLEDPALVDAFARVPREAFAGPGPWKIMKLTDTGDPYRDTVDADPARIYHDVLVAIDPARRLNNGQPSALARWISRLRIRPGNTAIHIGAGLGFYTAIIAELVGPTGRVVAYEVDPDLAARARDNLRGYPHVTVEAADASAPPRADRIFVNAGCTYARREWLDALAPGGRMVLPITVRMPHMPGLGAIGVMLRIERPMVDAARWSAATFSQVGIFDCANARDPAHEPILAALAASQRAREIRAVVTEPHAKTDACLAHIEGFCLQA